MNWIKKIHAELTENLRDWVKPIMWPIAVLIAVLCFVVGVVFIPFILLSFFIDKLVFTPFIKVCEKIFYKEPTKAIEKEKAE